MLRSLLGPVLAAALSATPPVPLLTLPASIAESSGLATSSRSDAWFFTHEDSGAPAQFEAVGTDGRLLVTFTLPGVQARDWEDMARGPDDRGRSALWLGDIGDNSASRDNGILVHRVPEPTVDPARSGVRRRTPAPTSFRLRYPDGPRDAETLLVHPRTGRLYVVTKPLGAAAGVYAAPALLDPGRPNVLERVGEARVHRTGTPGGPGIGSLAQTLVTGGDISPDGTRLALRTYTDLYEWRIPASADGDPVAAAVAGEPVVSALPETRQGEGVAYSRDGRTLLTSSEGVQAPVFRVPSAALGAVSAPSALPSVRDLVREPSGGVGALPWAAAALLAVCLLWWGSRSWRRKRTRRPPTDTAR